MKIIETGKVTIDASNIRVEEFEFESNIPGNWKSRTARDRAATAAMDWVEQRIAEARCEIAARTAEYSVENNRWVEVSK